MAKMDAITGFTRRPLDWGWVLATPFALAGLSAGAVAVVWLVRGGESATFGGLAVLALLFGAIGSAGLVKSYCANRSTIIRNRLAGYFPDEPWRWRPDWDAMRMVHSNRHRMIAQWVAAIGTGVVTVPIGIALVRSAVGGGDRLGWLGAALPAVSVYLLVTALRATQLHRQFGETVLELHMLPALVGGELVGTARTLASVHPSGGFQVHLSALHVYVVGYGQRRRVVRDVLWETSRTIAAATSAGGLSVEFTLPIPGDLPGTNDNHPNDEILWRLRVTGESAGRQFVSEFDVPIFLVT